MEQGRRSRKYFYFRQSIGQQTAYRPTEQRLFENNVMSYEFELSKDVLAIGLKKKYHYSEDRKMEARIRMENARKAKNKKSSD